MVCFEDTTSYCCWNQVVPDVYSVCWLDGQHPFSKETIPADVPVKLIKLGLHKTVNQARGFHYCELRTNKKIELADGELRCVLGTAETWIPGVDGQRCFAESWGPSTEMTAQNESSL